MTMNLNEVLTKQAFLSKVLFKSESGELSKELKVKIMNMRIALGKFRKDFENDQKEALEQVKPSNYDELARKADKTEEEIVEFSMMTEQLNDTYSLFIQRKVLEEVNFDQWLSEEEFEQIILTNCGEDVNINGTALSAPDFLEVLHELFVK